MFYQVTDNFAADCDAYDRWCADHEVLPTLCADCGGSGELYSLDGEEICVHCLRDRYTDERGLAMITQERREFVKWYYPDDDIYSIDVVYIVTDYLIAQAKGFIQSKALHPHINYPLLDEIKEYCIQDEWAWCEWLNKNT